MKQVQARRDFWGGVYRLADPKISITSVAAMIIGAAAAYRDGILHWGWLAVTGLALFCIEVAKNAWGDVFDYESGTDQAVAPEDRTPFSGGKRVLVDGLVTRAQTWGIAIGFGLAGIACGVAIVFGREFDAIWIGIIGMALGWSYHGPPLQFAYRGLGELDVVICYGPLIVLATYLIQTHQLSWPVFWLSVPLGLTIAAFLWVNEFPDYRADLSAGKHNLVVRLGRHRASRVFPLYYLLAFGILLSLPAFTTAPAWTGLGLIAVPAALYAVRGVWMDPDGFHRHRPVQPAALLTFVLYAIGVGAGLVIAS